MGRVCIVGQIIAVEFYTKISCAEAGRWDYTRYCRAREVF